MDALLNDLNDLGVGAGLSSRAPCGHKFQPVFNQSAAPGEDVAPSSARLSQSLAPPPPYGLGLAWAAVRGGLSQVSRRFLSKDVETSASTWSPEECMELRRLVTLHYFRQIFTKKSMATDTLLQAGGSR